MRTHPKHELSPLDVLTELAVEGTSSLVEAQRTLLDLAQRENDILLNGMKERIGGFVPGVAMTDMVRRSVDTLIDMQQKLLTNTSRQTLQWIESEKSGKDQGSARLVELAREAVETFMRAQQKFLDVVAQESAKATSGKPAHDHKPAKKVKLAILARDAANAFVEAQKEAARCDGTTDERESRSVEQVDGNDVAFPSAASGEPYGGWRQELFQQGNSFDRLADQSPQTQGCGPCQTRPEPNQAA
jgi:hypothetical protein